MPQPRPRRALNFNTLLHAWLGLACTLFAAASSEFYSVSVPNPDAHSFFLNYVLVLHPSVLHRLSLPHAWFMMHTPSLSLTLKTLFVHSSVQHLWPLCHVLCTLLPSEHRDREFAHPLPLLLYFLSFALCLYEHSFILRKFSTTFTAASLIELCNSPDANSSFLSIVCASITGVFLGLCPILDANSSILGMIVHPSAECSYRICTSFWSHSSCCCWVDPPSQKEDSHVSCSSCLITFALLVW